MKALVEGFMSRQPVAYVLFGIGAMITVVMEMLGLSSHGLRAGHLSAAAADHADPGRRIRFALGEQARGQDRRRAWRAIRERGVIVAGGLMAGGALGGVFGAALRLLPKYQEELIQTPFYNNEPISQSVSAIMFIGLCLYVWFASVRGKKAA